MLLHYIMMRLLDYFYLNPNFNSHFIPTTFLDLLSRFLFPGAWITKVEASDPTIGRQRITYSIFSGNENHIFSISGHTGKKHGEFLQNNNRQKKKQTKNTIAFYCSFICEANVQQL